MNETERFIVGVVFMALLFLVPAFVLHTSSRFAGRLAGFVVGVSAAGLILPLLIYPLAKYGTERQSQIGRRISMRGLLALHVYAGVFGAYLAILHTGPYYQSPFGVALVISMLAVVVTGFVGRSYLPQTSTELREQQARLTTLRSVYGGTVAALATRHASADGSSAGSALRGVPVFRLVDGIADLEYAIGSREALKKIFVPWIALHVDAAIAMNFLLALHLASEVYDELRWPS